MAGAIIVADQPTGAGAGSPGVARQDLWQSQQINLSVGTGGNISFQWDLLDKPPGSAAVLASPTTATPTFTPDRIGTYRLQLITNSGGPGNVQILVLRVRFSNTGVLKNRGHAPPAYGEQAGESNYGGNARGWAEHMELILADLRLAADKTVSPCRFVLPGMTGVAATQVAAVGGEGIGCVVLDPTIFMASNDNLTRAIRFAALLEVTPGVTAEIKLYNLNTGQVVTGTTLTTAVGGGPQRVLSAALTLGSSPLIPNALQIYEVQLRISNPAVPGGGDFAICKGAQFEITYN